MKILATLLAGASCLTAWPAGAAATVATRASLAVSVVTLQGKPVSDAVVWLEGRPDSTTKPTEIAQKDEEFDPFVTVVATGSRVMFPNRDKVKHHVYSFSEPKVFEIQLYSGTPAAPIVFDKPGVVVIGCNIHDWMLAYIAVVDSPWFAKTGADGLAKLPAVKAGTYSLHIWHPYQKTSAAVQTVEVGSAAGRSTFMVDLDVPPRKPRHPTGQTY